MPVSKRLRFEILRRDNHTCRYCGASGPDVPLTIDHVVPVTLGGSDDPANLVVACRDCNAGKSSVPADAPLIADVASDALRWSAAMRRAADHRTAELEAEDYILEQFECVWTKTWLVTPSATDTSSRFRHPGRTYARRPLDWQRSIIGFVNAELEFEFVLKAASIALHNDRIDFTDDSWRYFCGICWRELDKRREIAAAILKAEDAE